MADEKKIYLQVADRMMKDSRVYFRTPTSEREKYEKQYDTLKEMPAEVLANRVVQALNLRPMIEWVGIIATFIEQIREEYREEGALEKTTCKDCSAVTTHRTEKMEGIAQRGQNGDFILRCTICGKIKL